KFEDPNAGELKVVKISKSDITISGTKSKNYVLSNSIKIDNVTGKINRIDYTHDVKFEDKTLTYNRKVQNISVTGSLPTGEDGIRVMVSYSVGRADVGERIITASFFSNSINYNPIADMTAKLTIVPLEVTVSEGITAQDREYDGKTNVELAYSSVTIEGMIPGDNLTVIAVGNMENADTGTNK
ncbi:YDG domain-containing protein, partial [Candidatus Methanarcanum hacksteinii]|uniref:YDG domain-containing protein n=1 Tax=Candidatus Methanarcanum hacksteinii TaxID=2911857 RepID=UPI0037DD2376